MEPSQLEPFAALRLPQSGVGLQRTEPAPVGQKLSDCIEISSCTIQNMCHEWPRLTKSCHCEEAEWNGCRRVGTSLAVQWLYDSTSVTQVQSRSGNWDPSCMLQRKKKKMDVPRTYFASRCKFATSLGYLKDKLRCVWKDFFLWKVLDRYSSCFCVEFSSETWCIYNLLHDHFWN